MTVEIIDEPLYRERTFVFKDRLHAGRLLAEKLRKYAFKENVILLAIPAGGVPVAYEVAKQIGSPMDVIIVRKVQIPWNPEAGFGALAWDGVVILNEFLVRQLGLTEDLIERSVANTRRIVQERLRRFREDKPMPDLKGKVAVLIDDGLASGFTMLAAVRSVRRGSPERVVVAVPTAPESAIELLAHEVEEIVCLNIRSGPIFAVADAYVDWYDLTDEEVIEFLQKAQKESFGQPKTA